MKIAYLSTFYPYRGGIAQFNAALFNSFIKQADVKAYTFSLQYPEILFPGKTQLVENSDNVIKINAERILNTINPITYILTASKINDFKPDVVLTKFWMPFFAPSLGYVCGKLGNNTKSISILDNVIPHELRIGDMALIKYFLNKNDAFITMSETVTNDLLKIKPNAKYLQFPHPLYNHFGKKYDKTLARETLGLPKDKKILLCFGFIRDYKGIDIAIEAINKLSDEYHLVIAGEVYGNFEKYQKLIDTYNLKDKISVFTKYISDDETPHFFSAADACLLPYKSATQSGIIAISYHFDLPVIATNVGGLAEMVEKFGAGMMIPNPDSDSISRTIQQYFSQNTEKFVNNILDYKNYATWDNLAKSIIEFVKSLNYKS
jgi:glycosyltransferase involved in cell wall biosynthesis